MKLNRAGRHKGESVWILSHGRELVGSTGEILVTDYNKSTAEVVDLWAPERFSLPGRLVYTLKRKPLSRLDGYDIYPGQSSAPIVTERLKCALEAFCEPEEVAFRECEIVNDRGERRIAWNIYPTQVKPCVDRSLSLAVWGHSTQKPGVSWIEEAEKVVFLKECLGMANMVRVDEYPNWIAFSTRLKEIIEAFNSKGIDFRSDSIEILSIT
ncbi:hypothetical protein J2Y48_004665 [Mycoplana sp. BE70]|uniref:imm11 family protein n=1 Tax=Mycoplana sp. BE70 TaxID=2817775 RepID=UPI0028555862|nr:DUF1629 domain-containing protein [Mycoplana sp. BE70]MDR6759349.1 hypothetical protein [Mycoplana sp. BE70]